MTLVAVSRRISVFFASVSRRPYDLRVSSAPIKVIQQDVLRALGLLLDSPGPSLARTLAKTKCFFAKFHKKHCVGYTDGTLAEKIEFTSYKLCLYIPSRNNEDFIGNFIGILGNCWESEYRVSF